MLIKFTELLTIKTLRNIAKINGIKYISDLSKENLLIYLRVYKSILPVQRYFRLKNMTEDSCPISMEKIKYPFIVIKNHNKFNYYDFDTIVKYFSSTRDFRDPLTREKISDLRIQCINRLIRYYYGTRSNKLLWSDSMIKKMEFRCVMGSIDNLMNDIMTTKELTIDFIYRMVNPQFILYFQTLINNDVVEAYKIINTCIHTINDHNCINKLLIFKNILHIRKINNLN